MILRSSSLLPDIIHTKQIKGNQKTFGCQRNKYKINESRQPEPEQPTVQSQRVAKTILRCRKREKLAVLFVLVYPLVSFFS